MEGQNKLDDFAGMTVNERLFAAGLMDDFDKAIAEDKKRSNTYFEES